MGTPSPTRPPHAHLRTTALPGPTIVGTTSPTRPPDAHSPAHRAAGPNSQAALRFARAHKGADRLCAHANPALLVSVSTQRRGAFARTGHGAVEPGQSNRGSRTGAVEPGQSSRGVERRAVERRAVEPRWRRLRERSPGRRQLTMELSPAWTWPAYRPFSAISSSWVPASAMTPLSSTTMRSASRMVERRCAMTNAVRPCNA